MQGFRKAAIHLALAALILRALLPAGWMPNPQGAAETAFVICTMDGPVITLDGKVLPGKAPLGKDDPRAHETCPFAAAAQLAQSTDYITLAAPQLSRIAAPRNPIPGLKAHRTYLLKPATRAPPSLI